MSDNTINQKLLIVSSSPHLLGQDTTKKIMWLVVIALFPTAIFGVYAFGGTAALIVISSIFSAVITEMIILRLRKRSLKTIFDGSAVLTGLIVALNLPPSVPLYIPIISSCFAIGLVKQAFGGLGSNWANPAIAARIFALIAWTRYMTRWVAPFTYGGISSFINSVGSADVVTTATPLNVVKSAFLQDGVNELMKGPMDILQSGVSGFQTGSTYFDLFFGFKGGCIGEISIFLLLVGASYLIYKKIITLDVPVTFISTVLLLTWIFDGVRYGQGYFTGDVLFQLLTGGLVFGAFFCATDMVTTPITTKGRIIFGIGCGFLTFLIRSYGGLPEGVSLAILFMNVFTPAIDIFIKRRPMGAPAIKG